MLAKLRVRRKARWRCVGRNMVVVLGLVEVGRPEVLYRAGGKTS